jgi:beta-glucosidase
VGDGGTHKGIDENNTIISFHGLLSIHMAPYYTAIRKGVSTVMVSYSSWNGKKMHANHFLVTDFLKNKLRFRVSTSKSTLIFSRYDMFLSEFCF